MEKKKKIKFSLEKYLKYWEVLKVVRNCNIIVFFQYLSLNAKKDFNINLVLNDNNLKAKFILKKIMKKILKKKIVSKIQNFQGLLMLTNISAVLEVSKLLKKQNILVYGYYLQNFFFYKKDFILHKNFVNNNHILSIVSIVINYKKQLHLLVKNIISLLKIMIVKIYKICKIYGNN